MLVRSAYYCECVCVRQWCERARSTGGVALSPLGRHFHRDGARAILILILTISYKSLAAAWAWGAPSGQWGAVARGAWKSGVQWSVAARSIVKNHNNRQWCMLESRMDCNGARASSNYLIGSRWAAAAASRTPHLGHVWA
eukprot:scaffold25307_cov47-Tisochrysis_lutea.AAC.1